MIDSLPEKYRQEAYAQLGRTAPDKGAVRSSTYNKFGVAAEADRTDVDGRVYDSKHEMLVARRLRSLIPAEEITYQQEFELLPKLKGEKGAYRARKYVADFVVRGHVLDAKGMATPEYKLKRHLFFSRYGHEIIELRSMQDVEDFVTRLNKPQTTPKSNADH